MSDPAPAPTLSEDDLRDTFEALLAQLRGKTLADFADKAKAIGAGFRKNPEDKVVRAALTRRYGPALRRYDKALAACLRDCSPAAALLHPEMQLGMCRFGIVSYGTYYKLGQYPDAAAEFILEFAVIEECVFFYGRAVIGCRGHRECLHGSSLVAGKQICGTEVIGGVLGQLVVGAGDFYE